MTPPPTDAAACEPDKCPDCGMVLSVGAKACNERLVAAIAAKDARIRELVGALQTAVDCGRLCAEHQQVARATLAREKGGGA